MRGGLRAAIARLAVMAAAALLSAGSGQEGKVPPRVLPSDQYRAGEARAAVNARLERAGWCLHRQWPDADEWWACHVAKMDARTGEIFVSFAYVGGRLQRIVLFVPVPCYMHGAPLGSGGAPPRRELPGQPLASGGCDVNVRYAGARGRPWLDWKRGPVEDLHLVGLWAFEPWVLPANMTQKTYDALALELDGRYGQAVYRDWRGTGQYWYHRRADGLEVVGLFMAPGGAWIVETHEFGVELPPAPAGED